jgi:hypothetical protein
MSVLAKEINKKYELAQEFIQAGFEYAFKAGELLAEVESMVPAGELSTWLKQNCSEVPVSTAKEFLRLFKGEKVKIYAYTPKEKEVEET